MNRFLTAAELAAAYRLPQHIQDQLFGEVFPVEKSDQGEPLFLEAHVDAWLNARFAIAPWRSGYAVQGMLSRSTINTEQGEETAYITVAEAQRRYLAGKKSIRWWYRRIELKMIVHHRVGDSLLLRISDIEKFIAESRIGDEPETPTEPAPPIPVVPPSVKRKCRSELGENDGRFRFFPR